MGGTGSGSQNEEEIGITEQGELSHILEIQVGSNTFFYL
jgi:hypothetical protein